MSKNNAEIVMIGFGWVGQANAIALNKMGYSVSAYDPGKPDNYYTDHLDEYPKIERLSSPLEKDSENTWYMVTVGDIVSEEGVQDISLIKTALDSLKEAKGKVILRSTILPQKLASLDFDIYMPEFLHEKYAVEECFHPHLFIIGTREDVKYPDFLKQLEKHSYKKFKGTPEEASYIKYLSNIWNSVRIAFVNEFGDGVVTPAGVDSVQNIEKVLNFLFEGQSYLKYGKGFKGHCLPKDVRAFARAYKDARKNNAILEATYASNKIHMKAEEILPEWYSMWDFKEGKNRHIGRIWQNLNDKRAVQKIRKPFRFIVDGISKVVPAKSLEKTKKIWNEKGNENPDYYSNFYKHFDKDISSSQALSEGKADYARLVLADPLLRVSLGEMQNKRVLDFGCGVGRITESFANDFGEVEGVDIAPSMLLEAGNRLKKVENVMFVEIDGEHLPYKDNYFDFIFSNLTLQHVPGYDSLEIILEEMYRTLSHSGIAKIQLGTGRGYKKWHWAAGVTYPIEEAEALAREIGFEIVDRQIENIDHFWLTLRKEGGGTRVSGKETPNLKDDKKSKGNKKLTITGGSGYVGSRVANRLTEEGWDITVIDKATPKERNTELDSSVKFEHVYISLENYDAVKKALEGAEVVLHLAADIGPINYMLEKQADIMYNNMEADTALYRALEEVGARSIIYSSSSMIYQHTPRYPYKEEDASSILPPTNVYGFSKLAGEYFCKSYSSQYGMNYTILRYHNIYGPGEDSKGSTPGDIHVIPALCEKVNNGQYPLEFLGNPEATRPFTFIDDAVEATIKIIEKVHENNNTVINTDFNIGNKGHITILELGKLIWEKFGDDRPFKYTAKESKASKHSSFRREVDVSKVKNAVGWEATTPLDKGLDVTMEWIKSR
jgi:nucleoside-diphosphate-sugar epimerase/ubiquinone/menaquinone biosynthesis C-methylase UbiE